MPKAVTHLKLLRWLPISSSIKANYLSYSSPSTLHTETTLFRHTGILHFLEHSSHMLTIKTLCWLFLFPNLSFTRCLFPFYSQVFFLISLSLETALFTNAITLLLTLKTLQSPLYCKNFYLFCTSNDFVIYVIYFCLLAIYASLLS